MEKNEKNNCNNNVSHNNADTFSMWKKKENDSTYKQNDVTEMNKNSQYEEDLKVDIEQPNSEDVESKDDIKKEDINNTVKEIDALTGHYEGGGSTITIEADGKFTYFSANKDLTFVGTLPEKIQNGDKFEDNGYSFEVNFSEDFNRFSITARSLTDKDIYASDDLSRQ